MPRTAIVCFALSCVSAGVGAQSAPDISSVVFTPGPIADDILAVSSEPSPASTPNDRPSDGGNPDRLFESLERIEQSIAAETSLNGERSRNLIAEFMSLAAVHQALGDDALAIGALEQARGISRINDGLDSLSQVEIVDQLIETMEAAALFSESDSLQDALLELARKNDGDPRVPAILVGVADRQMEAVDRYLDEGIWPRNREPIDATEGSGWDKSTPRVGRHKAIPRLQQIYDSYDAAIEEALDNDDYEIGDPIDLEAGLAEIYRTIDTANDCIEDGNYRTGFYQCAPIDPKADQAWELSPTDRELARAAFRRARRLYSAAMQAALRADRYGEYLGLEEQLVETYYFELAHPELHGPPCYAGSCPRPLHLETLIADTATGVLQAKLIQRLTQGATAIDVARALIELGDWHLLLSRNRSALEKYQDAHDLLLSENVSAETMADLLSPGVPAMLPAFASNSMDFDPSRPYRGYIDASIEIGRFGQTKAVEVLDASPGTPPAVERRLARHVLQARFRPRFADGQPRRSDRFTARYYFDY